MTPNVRVSIRVTTQEEFVFSFPMAPADDPPVSKELAEKAKVASRVVPSGSSVLAAGLSAVVG